MSRKFYFIVLLIAGVWLAGVAQAAWQDPTAGPPEKNQERPLNVGDLAQQKTGALILSNSTAGLLMKDRSPLLFGVAGGNTVGFRASATEPSKSVIWTLPITDGANGYVLTTDGSGNLTWSSPQSNADPDWRYDPDMGTFTSIYSEKLTRVGSGGARDQASGAGDLYVQNTLEADGTAYLKNIKATGLDLGLPKGVIPFQGKDGLTYDQNWLVWTGGALGIGTPAPNDFTVQVAGSIGPNINNQFDLGSDSKRWRNIYVNQLDVPNLKISGLTKGSVIFQGDNGLTQDNANFFWDDVNNRLGLGTKTPAQTLDIKGNLGLTHAADGTSGFIFMDGKRFAGGSDYGNTFLGVESGLFYGSAGDEFWASDNTALGYQTLSQNNDGSYNTAVGSGAMFGNIGGYDNTALGKNALRANLNGYDNVAVGYNSSLKNTGAKNTTAVGVSALQENKADNVTALGFQAGWANNSGTQSVFVGNLAGQKNTSGSYNVYLGSQAGLNNQTGANNVFIGYGAAFNATGSGNVAIGKGAMSDSGAYENLVAVGFDALKAGGHNATAVGYRAGVLNTGQANTFLGAEAGRSNRDGYQNVFIGTGAGDLNDSGWGNVYLGVGAGGANVSGAINTFLGYHTDMAESGRGNVFVGANAGQKMSGNYNLAVDSSGFQDEERSGLDDFLIMGKFFDPSQSGVSPWLRFNGRVGIAPRGTTNFKQNSLLNIYQPAGANAEIDIQSKPFNTANNNDKFHWAIYHDRDTGQLRFWNAFVGASDHSYDLNNYYNNLLVLAYNGVGIGLTQTAVPSSRLEVHSDSDSQGSTNVLTLSNYNRDKKDTVDISVKKKGENMINFVSAVWSNAGYTGYTGSAAQLVSGFFGTTSKPYGNGTFKLLLPNPDKSGEMRDKAVFNDETFIFNPDDRAIFNSIVNVGGMRSGDNPNNYKLTVNGSIFGSDYYAGNDMQGATSYLCVARPGPTSGQVRKIRFEDGLYICSCDPTNNSCTGSCDDSSCDD